MPQVLLTMAPRNTATTIGRTNRARWGGGVLDRRDVLDIMHGRTRNTINPRIPAMPGRSMSGFH